MKTSLTISIFTFAGILHAYLGTKILIDLIDSWPIAVLAYALSILSLFIAERGRNEHKMKS